jgi:WD40 repeat protein
MEDPAPNQSSDDADPSLQIQQDLKGDDNQAIGQMKDSTAIGKIVGNVIYNYYYREEVKTAIDDPAASAEADPLPCPYRGLFHFGPGDAEYFFGRENFVEELVRATQTRNFIPLLGASGSGKSSVVLAGLVPKLQKAGHWQFTHFRPGADPFHALALALVPLYVNNLDETERIRQARNLAGYFRTGEVLLADVFAQIQQNFPTDRVLLIADQFEELYTPCIDETTRRNFLDRLLTGISAPVGHSPLAPILIATMRADFLGQALSYRPFADVLQNADLKLGPMNREELAEVIEKPAEMLGVTFEEGLVKRILDDVDKKPGILPLLEFALTELWKRRSKKQLTHAAYGEIGEVQGALDIRATQEYAKFSEANQERVRRIFIQLVRPGEGAEYTRRIATKAELGEQNWPLVKQLADVRLLVTSRNGANRETVEVVHEALIRNWGELRGWMEIDRVFRAWQERLRVMMGQWEKTQEDKGALLRGLPLMEAESWLQQRLDEISLSEKIFIETSITQQVREQKEQKKRRQFTILGLASGLVITSILTMGISLQLQKAQVSNYIARSESLFASNKGLEALIESIRAGKQSKSMFGSEPYINMQIIFALQQAIYGDKKTNNIFPGNLARFSPSGKIIATVNNQEINLWNLNGQKIKTIGDNKQKHGDNEYISSLDFSPDSKMLVSCSHDIKLWSLDGTLIKSIKEVGEIPSYVKFSHDGKVLATFFNSGMIKLLNLDGTVISSINQDVEQDNTQSLRYRSISFSANGKMFVTTSKDTIKLWKLDGTLLKTLKSPPSINLGYEDVVFSQDGNIIAALEMGGIDLWKFDGSFITTLKAEDYSGGGGLFNSLSFSPDNKLIAAGMGDSKLRIWNLENQEYRSLDGHGDSLNSVMFSPDGKMLTSSGYKYTVLWNLIGKEPINFKGSTFLQKISFSRDNKTIVVTNDRNMGIIDLNGTLVRTIPFDSNHQLLTQTFSPDAKTLAVSRFGESTKLFSFNSTIPTIINEKESTGLTFSPDSQMLVSIPNGGDKISFWNLKGSLIKTVEHYFSKKRNNSQLAFSPNMNILASSYGTDNIKFTDLEGNQIKIFKACSNTFGNIAFSPDGKKIASSCDSENAVKIWNIDGNLLVTLKGHNDIVTRFEFSPDGNFITTISQDKTLKLWTIDGMEIKTFKPEGISKYNEKQVMSAGFSRDGKVLALGYNGGEVVLRSLDLDSLLQLGCNSIHNYLETNVNNISERDRHICDGI